MADEAPDNPCGTDGFEFVEYTAEDTASLGGCSRRSDSGAEKDHLLARLVVANDATLAHELVQRMRRERGGQPGVDKAATKRRTVAALLQQAKRAAEEQRRIAAEMAALEKARRDREAAIARSKYLDRLAGKELAIWKQVESLVGTKQPKSYDQAVSLLVDLRDLAARNGGADFRRRVEELRATHARKPSFFDRLRKARL